MQNTAWGVPVAAQSSLYSSKSSSISGKTSNVKPIGGMPPMAKPVCWRTKSASDLSIGSPPNCSTFFSSTRFLPLAMIQMGLPVFLPLKIKLLAICPTSQPIASVASCAVRVSCLNSIKYLGCAWQILANDLSSNFLLIFTNGLVHSPGASDNERRPHIEVPR